MASEPLEINLADPADVRRKVPQIKALLETQRKQRAELDEQIELLERIVGEPAENRTAPAGKQRSGGKGTHRSPGQDRAVEALEKAGRPMGPKDLYAYMKAENLDAPANPNALGTNLWAAERAGRIKKSKGKYLPLSYPDWNAAAELGSSVPDHLPSDAGDTVQ